jgi:hypothetical protein
MEGANAPMLKRFVVYPFSDALLIGEAGTETDALVFFSVSSPETFLAEV